MNDYLITSVRKAGVGTKTARGDGASRENPRKLMERRGKTRES
jgi:hypothetical protein